MADYTGERLIDLKLPDLTNDVYIITKPLGNYKLMLWDNNLSPIFKPITSAEIWE